MNLLKAVSFFFFPPPELEDLAGGGKVETVVSQTPDDPRRLQPATMAALYSLFFSVVPAFFGGMVKWLV